MASLDTRLHALEARVAALEHDRQVWPPVIMQSDLEPAPQQPRSCDNCKWDIRLWHKKPRPQGHCSKCKLGHEPDSWDGWQPRGGGG